ncbi:MAG: GAF domain-containing protein [Woeseiaceae bacterium]
MQEAKMPENEATRITALRSLGILDTPSEDRFDRYTRITARIFDMPIALISLLDGDRQWFKSAEGIDVEQTPRKASFCGHAILGDSVFEVRNARRDPRFRDNPMVLEPPHVRFYAGAPLETPDGHKLGTLCIIDSVPRQLSDDEKTMLKNLADMVVGEILKDVRAEAVQPERAAQTLTGAEFFDSIPEERGHSVLLFDIDDVLASHDELNLEISPGEIFTGLLHDYFPMATSIAHVGDYHFCVLIKSASDFDEVRAINHLCSDAKDLLCFAEGHDNLTPFVGRIQYNSSKYASVDDVLRDANRMFLNHERQPASDGVSVKQFVRELVGWRKTIF